MSERASVIELRHLRYFVAVAEHGSFRRAGAAVGVQQSALSRRIRDLEDCLGAALFHRHSNGVRLTFAGRRFLSRAHHIIRNLNEGAHDVASVGRGEHGSVRIGIYSSIASGFLAELLRAYGRQHPEVHIELIEGGAEAHIAALRTFRLDVAFLTGAYEWPDYDSAHLWSERVFLVLPEHHGLTAREELAWVDLANESFIVGRAAGEEIHDYLADRLAGIGRQPKVQMQSVGWDNLLPLVALGRGLTLVGEAMIAARFPGIVYRLIAGETFPFSAIWSANNDNPAFRRLLSMAKASARVQGEESI